MNSSEQKFRVTIIIIFMRTGENSSFPIMILINSRQLIINSQQLICHHHVTDLRISCKCNAANVSFLVIGRYQLRNNEK